MKSTECRPIGAADEHCPVPRTLLHGRIRLLTPTESEIVVADPFTGMGDGTVVAHDDESTQELWTFNLGSGINAPPMTFEVGGKQYRAIMTGLSQMNEMRNQTMLFLSAL